MSKENGADTSCCASCGIAEVDDIKLLNKCTDCDLVKYCSIKCQRKHTPLHEEACIKRYAQLREELLFKQPESSHLGDCPICCLPMPLDLEKSIMYSCCSKVVCIGCNYANKLRIKEARLDYTCPFCRKPAPKTDEETKINAMKRVEANDPVALHHEGVEREKEGDYRSAYKYLLKAAELLGDVEAHYQLAGMYHDGDVVEKDRGKEIYHLEEAAIGGHPYARYDLGYDAKEYGIIERAVRHWIISANLGDGDSIKALMDAYKGGFVSKEDLADALRGHQAAVDATKSPQREAAENIIKNRESVQAEDC